MTCGGGDLAGAGVYYGAGMTEAIACKGEDVLCRGGANSPAAAVHSRNIESVTMRPRRLAGDQSHYLIERINQHATSGRNKLAVAEAIGTPRLEALVLQHTRPRATHVPHNRVYPHRGNAAHRMVGSSVLRTSTLYPSGRFASRRVAAADATWQTAYF